MKDGDIGHFARSLAGHDKGEIFIILSEQAGIALVADGKGRSLETPKRKNKKHLQVIRHTVDVELHEKLESGHPVRNEDIKRAIKLYCASE